MAETEIKEARRSLYRLRGMIRKLEGKESSAGVEQEQCPECHSRDVKRHGFYRSAMMRVQRWACQNCGKSFRCSRKVIMYRGVNIGLNRNKVRERAKFAIDLLIGGYSQRQVCAKAGLYGHTVAALTAELRLAGMMPTYCPCGGKAGHRGWCKDRFARSARRQAVLAKLHERQRKESYEQSTH